MTPEEHQGIDQLSSPGLRKSYSIVAWGIFASTTSNGSDLVQTLNMAIIGRSESGFLVDHMRSISEPVSPLSFSCKDVFFALFEPYFRSSRDNSSGTRKRKVRT